MNDPELKVLETESLVVIRDKFPKARHHYLVLPKAKFRIRIRIHGITGSGFKI